METSEHVGYAGISKITGMPIGTLYSLVNQKRIPHFRIGKRHVLFSVVEIRQWLNKHKIKACESAMNNQTLDKEWDY